MSAPFLIRHKDGREYELESVAEFDRTYRPAGFFIVEQQPRGRAVPEPVEAEPEGLEAMTRAELDAEAERLGIEDADKLRTKADVVKAIEARGDELAEAVGDGAAE